MISNIKKIESKIHLIRRHRVMLDYDLAEFCGLNKQIFDQIVESNVGLFLEDFMFQLTEEEWQFF